VAHWPFAYEVFVYGYEVPLLPQTVIVALPDIKAYMETELPLTLAETATELVLLET
jgi:hypothetical protein